MNFQLSPELDRNKVFLIQRSELEGRIDPHFYAPKKRTFFKKLKENINNIPLKQVMVDASYGVLPPGDSYNDSNEVLFLRATELKPDLKADFEKVYKVEDKFLTHKRAVIKDRDILIAVKGATIASEKSIVYVENAPSKAIVNGSIFRFQAKEGFDPKFIAYMLSLDVVKKQMKFNLVANNAVDYLDKPLLNNLLIFSPPKEIQTQIVSKMDAAYANKKQKETEAQRLLAGIDGYLLGELGIQLPEQKESTLQSRMFTRQLSEVSGRRFDPYPYQERFLQLDDALTSMNVPIKRLKEIVVFLDYGLMPTQDYAFTEDDGLPMIRVTNIKSDGSIDMTDTKYIKFDTPRLYKKLVKSNDILMVQCGNTTGKCALVPREYEGYTFGSFSFVIRGKSKTVLQNYLFNVLSSFIVQEQLNRSMTITSVRPNTTKPEVLNFNIPIPPLEKQTEIANHITEIRKQAKQLQQQAKVELEEAKKEVEAMILGKDESNA